LENRLKLDKNHVIFFTHCSCAQCNLVFFYIVGKESSLSTKPCNPPSYFWLLRARCKIRLYYFNNTFIWCLHRCSQRGTATMLTISHYGFCQPRNVMQGCIFFNELWCFPPPPSFQIWFFSPYLYYISRDWELPLVQRRPAFLFGVLWPMEANGGIDKHRQNEIKMKENWRKWNFEGNFNALNFDQNQKKIRKNHFGKWKHWFSRITHGNFSLLFPLPFHFFYSSLIFFPSPKTLWLFSPTPGWGGGDYRRIYTPDVMTRVR
jgi:hypothetical protein